MVRLSLVAPEIVRRPARWEFHTRSYVSRGRRPGGSWGLTYRVPAGVDGQYTEIELRPLTSWAVSWQEGGSA